MRARAPVIRHRTLRRRALRRRAVWTCGELLVTLGTVLALLVVHQLWWTNRQAEQGARREVRALEKEWGNPGGPGGSQASPESGSGSGSGSGSDNRAGASGAAGQDGAGVTNSRSSKPSWSQAYAVLSIPRLGLRVPVAEGVSKPDVLNKGYVGHYPGTQQPGQAGNFALAGHRNTHGEPFRYINRLRRGDAVRVETADAVYSYTVDRTLPQTSAHDDGVIRTVPRSTVRPAYGYRAPGHYLTLTTCTPEYTSRYRLVVWGTLTSVRPR
ncbi:class E sortase [Streptomyces sp. WI04-05B]|uniref:class E sortase n=1 Tax=Streptomyces TaxID=1883 RepID=UPI0029B4AAA7|nr:MULTISPECIES: class E sortase [unclassified Streptomyces]MDX2543775.1 class E sortase [Streptomyces sp. WI04-05B]MDX2582135.1 class E sortase [Streptomyces sp. WI04-05A]MDX3752549.1 class E sortase [Streptomyces sp. AK08-02]